MKRTVTEDGLVFLEPESAADARKLVRMAAEGKLDPGPEALDEKPQRRRRAKRSRS